MYSWRWVIGRRQAAFYGTVVRKRPTFVSWPLLPAILRLVADLRTPDELYDFGVISHEAYRIAQVLDGSAEPVGTAEIRKRAGFPTGKEQSAAYHKGLAELENRLLVTSEFSPDDGEGTKHHGLMFARRRDDVIAAERMTREDALDVLLRAYLGKAQYIAPAGLSRVLRIPEPELAAGVARLESEGVLRAAEAPGVKGRMWLAARRSPATSNDYPS